MTLCLAPEIEGLLVEVVADGFTVHCCGPRTAPRALVASYRWEDYVDLATIRRFERVTTARVPVPRCGRIDVFAPATVVWAYEGPPQRALRALLDLVHPQHPDAPTSAYPAPPALCIARAEQRPMTIRLPPPGPDSSHPARRSAIEPKGTVRTVAATSHRLSSFVLFGFLAVQNEPGRRCMRGPTFAPMAITHWGRDSKMPESSYTTELKQSLTGRPDARFVWLCNFEVENEWAHNYVGLPVPRLSTTTATVQRMEELGALIAEPVDYLLLGKGLDGEYRRYVERLGLGLPTELVARGAPDARTSQSVLGSPELLRQLSELAEQGAFLMPMGTSAEGQKISDATGLRMAVPDADTFERVNSKIYSRRLVEELGLRAIPGYACETVEQLRNALGDGPSKEHPVIVKDAFGVSGKGQVILDSPTKAQRLLRMVEQRARRTGIEALHVVVERFLTKRCDLNYQFTIDRGGGVRFAFVKEALTVGGVHKGHIQPPALTATQYQEIAEGAERIGARLYADGFFGVVGVDALLGADDLVYPVLEINARLNMSSYQGRINERFLRPGHAALAKHYPLRLSRPVSFDEVRNALGGLAVAPEGGTGLVITCFGTVNAQATTSAPFDGRLYTILFAADRTALAELDVRVTDALGVLKRHGR